MFQNQQNSGARGGPLGSGRLQNGKLGGGSQWAFGGPMGGAPGLSSAQTRTNGGGLSSFAQTIGNSQPHTPLNLEEFPSLSGAPQAQQNTSAQQMWSNPTLRTAQHPTIQRPQQNTPQGQSGSAPNAQHQQIQSQSHEDGNGAASGQFSGSSDDYRFGGQAGVGQLSGGGQPQTGNIEEFPPLGGAGDVGPDRRTGMIQNAAAFGGSTNSGAFPGLGQTRNGLSSPTEGQQDRTLNPAVGGVSRTSFGGNPGGLQDGNLRTGQPLGNIGNPSFGGSQLTLRGVNSVAPIGQRPQQSQFDPPFSSETLGSPNAQPSQHKKLADMTDSERYGLPGLLSMIPLESPDYSSLAVGQDLTVLGLDLSRPDNSPLHPTFGSPFVESNVKPVIPPDYTLPAAYTVTNVPPLHMKMGSFSAETLLAIFYQFPRDIYQELAAQELFNRDWRWHTKLQQWMMKDPDLPQPMRISSKLERGWYLFFDVSNWRRERVGYTNFASKNRPCANLAVEGVRAQLRSSRSAAWPCSSSLTALSQGVREMTPTGAKPIPTAPVDFNLLARPTMRNPGACAVCNYPGHKSKDIKNSDKCRAAIMSTISFWENTFDHINTLYRDHQRFTEAIQENEPTYEMRRDEGPPKGTGIEEIIVNRLTRNYLKFQAHFSGIRAKAKQIMKGSDEERYEKITELLNDYLLNKSSLSELFEQSLADKMDVEY
ncbi:hypothetical protein BDV96DRAFT_496683 [Lophiotrema nucula]|uniref:NOT2/NOT3/NOT5 C-terminal domain-containing protein n=1 Tax=Lophiotrema nucula TaxID=690887 RepID=A0A6A5Z3L5_9PLEO|nr:hypothetical protein BDV96DRAFT_496683 [Lophiotrema nucula]